MTRRALSAQSGSRLHVSQNYLRRWMQNNDLRVVLNIRKLRSDHSLSSKGPWADIWNGTVSRCVGFEPSVQVRGDSLPYYPSMVAYGHTASRGLDIHRWTVGLDTGCVYGRRLTARILDSNAAQSSQESVSLDAIEARAYHSRENSDGDEDDEEGGSDGVKSNRIPSHSGTTGERDLPVSSVTSLGGKHSASALY
ncbi:hypothetical protein V8E53_004165 [Lactarius tabidus]